MSVKEMLQAIRDQGPYEPDMEAWRKFRMDNDDERSYWLDMFNDMAPSEPEPPPPKPEWTKNWEHGTLPTPKYAVEVLSERFKVKRIKEEVSQHGDRYRIIVTIARKIVIPGKHDIQREFAWADSEAGIPDAIQQAHRDALVRSVGSYGLRKMNQHDRGI